MVDTTEKFLIDSNSFITPYRFYYAFDLVPSYWKELSKHAESSRIMLLDMVKTEINQGKDSLTDWIHENETSFMVCNHKTGAIVSKYQEVMRYVQTCGYYNNKAITEWSKATVADPWLIATAAVNGYTIISDEATAGTLSIKNKSKNPKIPDVAKAFGVKSEPLFYMMREFGIEI